MALTRRAFSYAVVAFVTLVLAALVLQLWRADFSVPFYYAAGGEVFLVVTLFKIIAETGWIEQSANLGMPFGAEFYGYPSTSAAHDVAIKVLLFFVKNPIAAMNTYFLLGFPLSAMTAFHVLRRFGVTRSTAAGIAILFSFLPYRFFRNEAHIFYASYFFVPLSIMVVLWVARGDTLFRFSKEALRRPAVFITRHGFIALTVCFILASDNPYDTFFFAVLIVCGLLIAVVRKLAWKAVVATSLILLATIAFGFALNLTPTWLYNGTHPDARLEIQRAPVDSETYSLTLAQLLLPIEQHRLAPLAEMRAAYDAQALAVNENTSASLGFIGAIGFLLLTSRLLFRIFARPKASSLLDDLATLNAISFLLATFGGFGALFAFYVSDVLHAYNRIAPFIAFLSLFAVAIVLDRALAGLRTNRGRRAFAIAAVTGLVAVGLLDQTSAASVPPYAANSSSFASMQRFTDAIEASLPAGASVFELPVIAFPETTVQYPRILPSEELMPFVHSKALRWSYGSFPDSSSNVFQNDAASGTPRVLAFKLALAGFGGLLIDRNGYADGGAGLQKALSPLAVIPPIASEDGKWLFFNLTQYTAHLAQRFGRERFSRVQQLVANPIDIQWRSGCSLRSTDPARVFRWCGHDAVLALSNQTAHARSLRLSMVIVTRSTTPSAVDVDGPAGHSTFMASVYGAPYVSHATLPPHSTSLVLIHTDAPELPTPGVATPLIFELANLSVQDANGLDRMLREYDKP
jgi:phosphoglycerol transferase